MTIGGSTATQKPASLEKFTGYSVVKKNADGDATVIENPAAPLEPEAWSEFETKRSARLKSTSALASAEINIPQQELQKQEQEQPDLKQQALQYFLDPQSELEMEGPPAPPPKPVVHRSRQEVCESLVEAAQSNDLPTPFFIRLLQQESGFKPGVVSPVGAQGVAQFMPGTAAEMGVDNPFDPLEAIPASARMLKNLYRKFGSLGLAAAAYNAGPKRIQDWLERKGKLPTETRGYVKTITGYEAESWKVAAAGMTNIKLPRVAPCQQEAGLHAWDGPRTIPLPPQHPRSVTLVAEAAPAVSTKAKKSEHGTIVQLAAHRLQKTDSAQKTNEKAAVKTAAKKSGKKPGKPMQLADAAR